MATEPPSNTPPYASYTSFRNYLEHLRGKPLPSRIDKSVMSHLNYGTQQALMAALRSLGFIGEGDAPTTALELLVAATDDDRKALLLEAIKAAYPYFWSDKIDLSRATSDEFQAVLREATNAQGSTASKAGSFFFALAADAGVELSPHLTSRKASNGAAQRRGKAKPRKPKQPAGESTADPAGRPAADQPKEGLTGRLMDKFPGFDPSWPDPIKEKWFAAFEKLMKSAEKAEKAS